MRIQIFILTHLFSVTSLFGQAQQTKTFETEVLSHDKTKEIFNDKVKTKFNISYPIFKVYSYKDKSGEFYLVLTESNDSITIDKDTLHSNIKAFNLIKSNTGLVKKWEINDFKIKQINNEGLETSISFLTKYCEFQDIDNDNIIDPILVYGSAGINGYGDGRIKILIFYKEQKITIRHQNGILDFWRNTKVDKAFYSLPLVLQNHVKDLMQKMVGSDLTNFPDGWQDAMSKHKLYFDENK
ncbi:MAG: hypothetical protein ABI723_04920 [Bacteroidia bacterium]